MFVGGSTQVPAQDDDSDEDDKPIAQTRAGLQAASVPVSAIMLIVFSWMVV